MTEPDVVEYPDSGYSSVVADNAPGGVKSRRASGFAGRATEGAGYWSMIDDEPDNTPERG